MSTTSKPSTNPIDLAKLLVTSIAIGATLGSSATNAATVPATANNLPAQNQIATAKYLEGFFIDSDWSVNIYRQNGRYYYRGTNLHTQAYLNLAGGNVYKAGNKQVYTWHNRGTKYRVTWQPKYPHTIRLYVIDNYGRVVVNRLLQWQKAEDFL
ncbi:hypothetical protein [Chamaesiphon polymorphus]|uniref:Uncharacterized protein n=1 Tax=Chamaesiphon polymorphus CCALA 037 TaxID=2107692 RepID=A0A2T1FAU4_9CYAN|nr:hypothetical protein [Chamaesiphon polymorphus]PSB42130.1 hypothetical protein C7B77_26895 [Chamaesiphon polymorphus CCALA 037]